MILEVKRIFEINLGQKITGFYSDELDSENRNFRYYHYFNNNKNNFYRVLNDNFYISGWESFEEGIELIKQGLKDNSIIQIFDKDELLLEDLRVEYVVNAWDYTSDLEFEDVVTIKT